MKKITRLIAVIMILSLVLVGCGAASEKKISFSAESPSTASGSSETDSEPQGEGGIQECTINYLAHYTKDRIGSDGVYTGVWTAIDQFRKDYPNVTLNVETLDQTAYQEKIYTLAASGDIPEAFALKGSWIGDFVNNDWVKDISSALNAEPEWKANYNATALDETTMGDAIYGLPVQIAITSVIYYNKEMWASIGYDKFPSTINELKTAIKKFVDKGIIPFALGNQPAWPAESRWLSTFGDRYTGSEWTYSIIRGEGAKFTDERFIAAVRDMQEFANLGAFNKDINSRDQAGARELYLNGEVATIVDGNSFGVTMATTASEEMYKNTGLAVFPAGDYPATTVSGGSTWHAAMGTSVTDKTYDATLTFLKYLTGDIQATVNAEMGGGIALNKLEYDDSKLPPMIVEYFDLISKLEIIPVYDGRMSSSVIEVMNTGLQEVLINKKTPEQLAEEIQREYEMQ